MQSVKWLLLLFIITCCKLTIYAQHPTPNSKILNTYIGLVPMDIFGRNGYFFMPADSKYIGMPNTTGLSLEVMGQKRNSYQINIEYALFGYKYTRYDKKHTTHIITGAPTTVLVERNYRRLTHKLRLMLQLNHAFIQEEYVTGYLTFGLGVKFVRRYENLNGTRNTITYDFWPVGLNHTLIPVAGRIGIGGKWKLNKQTQLLVEAGFIGGAPLRFGLGFKL